MDPDCKKWEENDSLSFITTLIALSINKYVEINM